MKFVMVIIVNPLYATNFILIVYVLSLSTDVKLTIIRYLESLFNLQTRYNRIFYRNS